MRWFDRTAILVTEAGFQRLQNSNVLIAGLGGVGGFAAESICRAGVGHITIVDGDVVSVDNRNRQLVALHSTVGQKKSDVLRARLLDINPSACITAIDDFLQIDTIQKLLDSQKYDYVIDAIDTLTPKTQLIAEAVRRGIKVVSSMGAGAKFDPTKIQVTDISKTFKCPLAQRVRYKLKELGVTTGVEAVFSSENFDREKFIKVDGLTNKKTIVGTISYLPPIFGGFCAAQVIQYLLLLPTP